MIRVTVRTVFNHIDEVQGTLRNEEVRLSGALADHMAGRARTYAPVDTGNLRRTIGVERVARNRADVVSDTGEGTADGRYRDYHHHVEFGSFNTRTDEYQPARPYMTPAASDGMTYAPTLGGPCGARITTSAISGKVI